MIIYKTTNLINNKIYIGQSKNNYSHYYGSGKLIKKALKKYGVLNFKKEILVDNIDDLDMLNNLEIYYINLYNSIKNGYNIHKGGRGNTEECNYKISNHLINNKFRLGKKLRQEHKDRISITLKNKFKDNTNFKERCSKTALKVIEKGNNYILNLNEINRKNLNKKATEKALEINCIKLKITNIIDNTIMFFNSKKEFLKYLNKKGSYSFDKCFKNNKLLYNTYKIEKHV